MKLPYKGAGVALFKKIDNEYAILLGKRKYKPGVGKWSIPGGGYESKEDLTLFMTAKRELQQETDIKLLKIINIKGPIVWRRNWLFFRWETYMYEVAPDFPVPTHYHEFSEMKFIPLNELGKYKLAFGVKSEIKHFLRNISKKVYR